MVKIKYPGQVQVRAGRVDQQLCARVEEARSKNEQEKDTGAPPVDHPEQRRDHQIVKRVIAEISDGAKENVAIRIRPRGDPLEHRVAGEVLHELVSKPAAVPRQEKAQPSDAVAREKTARGRYPRAGTRVSANGTGNPRRDTPASARIRPRC